VQSGPRPKLVAAILVGASAVAAGGATAALVSSGHSSHLTKTAATQPETPASTPTQSPSVSVTRPPTAAPTVRSSPSVPASVTYVVKHGDTLSGIADWFKLHGYGDLYSANIAQIGPNPNLIIPGERITISGTAMTIQRS
jgi:nucleoid-associated protein YgaU